MVNKESIKFENRIRVERDSVCMGDDCNAPNASELIYEDDERISDLIIALAEYIPKIENTVWSISCKGKSIMYLIFDDNLNYTYELAIQDIKVSELEEKKLFCNYYYEGRMLDYSTKPPTIMYPKCATLIEKVKAQEKRAGITVRAEIRDFDKLSNGQKKILIPLAIWGLFSIGSLIIMGILDKIHNGREIDYYKMDPYSCIMTICTLMVILSIICLIPMVIIMLIKANNGYKRTWITKDFNFEVIDEHIYYNEQQMFVNYDKKRKRIYVHDMDNKKEPYKATFYATIKEPDVYTFLEYLETNNVKFDKEYLPNLHGKNGSLAQLGMSQYRRY